MRHCIPALTIVAVLFCAHLKSFELSGPVSGHVLDAKQGRIRPVNGFPGAALMGVPIELPIILQSAVIRESGDLAVGIAKESGAVTMIKGLSSNPAITTHEEWLSKCDLVAITSTGAVGVAYSKSNAKMIRFRNGTLETSTATLDYGDVTTVAVSDRLSLFATRTHLYRWVGESIEFVSSFGEISSIVFVNGDRDVVIADSARQSVYLIADIAGGAETSLLLDQKDGVGRTAAVCLGKEDRLLVANEDSTALVLDLPSRSMVGTLYLPSKPTRCEPMKSSNLLVLNDAGEFPLVLVDLSEMASFFVPSDNQ